MRFYWFKEIPSTQTFLVDLLKQEATLPSLVVARNQTGGIGSRGNKWQSPKLGLYLSLALHESSLPRDLPLQSSALYFGWLFLERLRAQYPNLWLKWPNDYYKGDKKVGGLLTQSMRKAVILGLGLNIFDDKLACLCDQYDLQRLASLLSVVMDFLSFSGIEFSRILELDSYTQDLVATSRGSVFTFPSWQSVFHKYQQEFHKNRGFSTHVMEGTSRGYIRLEDCRLREDGALVLGDEVFYSRR